jgi:hypothetical protein
MNVVLRAALIRSPRRTLVTRTAWGRFTAAIVISAGIVTARRTA